MDTELCGWSIEDTAARHRVVVAIDGAAE